MNWSARSVAVLIGLAGAAVASVGLAAPASAAYPNDPAPQAWTADGPVHALKVAGGRVYVGQTNGGIVALDASTGALVWSASTDGDVRALTVSADGTRVFAGGGFVTVNGQTHRRLVALSATDGSVVTDWKASTGGMVRDLVVTGDTMYVGGNFGASNGVSQRGLAAVSVSTGKRVASFNAFVNKNVYALAIAGSRLVAAGNYTSVNNVARNSLASFDLSSGALTSWYPARVCTQCPSYWDIAVDQTNVYVGSSGPGGQLGSFNLSTGQIPWKFIHADGDVQAVTVASDGLVYFGGHFGQFAGSSNTPRTLLAAANPANGSIDPNFAPKLFTTYPGVWALDSTPSRLYAGGYFTGVRSGTVNNKVPYYAVF